MLGKFTMDPIFGMFLSWLPDFLDRRYHLDLKSFGPPLIVIYLISDGGSVGGGWLSHFLNMGWSVNRARKITMLICALAATR
jgi:ACS family hexuronate transporter-like MFS transporter